MHDFDETKIIAFPVIIDLFLSFQRGNPDQQA